METLVNVKNISSRFFEKVFDENLGTLRETIPKHRRVSRWPREGSERERRKDEEERREGNKRIRPFVFILAPS